jgi:hypothetical protein
VSPHTHQRADAGATDHGVDRPKTLTPSDVQCPEALVVDAARRALGLSHAQLARISDTSKSMVGKWCNPHLPNVPNFRHMRRWPSGLRDLVFAKDDAPAAACFERTLLVLGRELGELQGAYLETAPDGRTCAEWRRLAVEAADVERVAGDIRKISEARSKP